MTLGDLDRESSSGDEQTLDITQIELVSKSTSSFSSPFENNYDDLL